MSADNFLALQALHEEFLHRQLNLSDENKQGFLEEVTAYIAQTKNGGANISDAQEREQLRAILRYWANYTYNIQGVLPDTELAPSRSKRRISDLNLSLIISFIVLVVLGLLVLSYLSYSKESNPEQVQAAVVQTLTALSWTPTFTPYPTVDPNEQLIVNQLNAINPIENIWDELENTLGADIVIFDINFPLNDGVASVMQVYVRCECATNKPCCTPEQMFILTMKKFYLAVKENPDLLEQVPVTVQEMKVVCLDHKRQFAVITVPWHAVESFLLGEINGYVLGRTVTQVP